MHSNIYMNPHPAVPQQQMQQMQRPMMQQQPVPIQLPPNIQLVMTNMGPQYYDTSTGQYVTIQQPQMVQRPQMMHGQNPQMMYHTRGQGQQFQPQARLMTGQQVFQPEMVGDGQDNRFDAPPRQNPTQFQQASQENTQMRVPTSPTNTATIVQEKKFVPGKKLLKSKSASFLPRTRPFMEDEIQSIQMNVASGGFSMAVEELYEQSYMETDKNKIVVAAKCVLSEAFFETSLRGLAAELFQQDIEMVYRFMKQSVDSLTARGDIVFMSEYNQWLTDQINDYLTVLMTEPFSIDSFVEDFNDLKKALGVTRTPSSDLSTVYEELCNRLRRVLSLGADTHKQGKFSEGGEEISADAVYLVEKANILFCKMMSTEIWKDGIPDTEPDGNRLISSLAAQFDEEIFYLMTLDKVIYKVIVTLQGVVNVTLIGH